MTVKKVTIRSQLRTGTLLKLQTGERNIADFEDDKENRYKVQELTLDKDKSTAHVGEQARKHEAKVQENDAPIDKLQNNKRTEQDGK